MGSQGTTTVNFGAFPGNVEASVVVTGQAGILASSLVEAWLFPSATADHSADEHYMASAMLAVMAGEIVAGTGFTIRAFVIDQGGEALHPVNGSAIQNADVTAGNNQRFGEQARTMGGTTLGTAWGQFTVAWVWN